jgi:uncharacterized protein
MRHASAIAVSVAALMGAGAVPAAAQETAEPPTIAAVGVGRVLVRPDQAEVFVSARRVAPTSRGARRLANRRVDAIRRAALANGVAAADIRTVGVSVSRHRRRARRGRPARTYYSASSELTILVRRIDSAGEVVDALADAGGNVFGPEFSVSDTAGPTIEATRTALADARRRAEDAAARSGHRITGIRSIDLAPGLDDSGGGDDAASGGGGEAITDIEPGREEIVALVRVVYSIAPA